MRDLNLVPYEIKEKKLKLEKNRKYTSYVILVLCIIFVLAYFPLMYSKSLENKAAGLKNQVDSKAYIINRYNEVTNSISQASKPIAIAETIDKNKVYLSNIIDNISKYTPSSNFKFTAFSYQNGDMALNGTSSNYNSCCEFIANLETSEEFAAAKLNSLTYNKDDKTYTFSIIITQKEARSNEQAK